MNNKTMFDLPFDFSNEMKDLWTIFTKCPIEQGSLEVYSAFAQARAMAFKNYQNQNLGQEM